MVSEYTNNIDNDYNDDNTTNNDNDNNTNDNNNDSNNNNNSNSNNNNNSNNSNNNNNKNNNDDNDNNNNNDNNDNNNDMYDSTGFTVNRRRAPSKKKKSTHVPGFQSFFQFFASFRISQISHHQHKG